MKELNLFTGNNKDLYSTSKKIRNPLCQRKTDQSTRAVVNLLLLTRYHKAYNVSLGYNILYINFSAILLNH